MPPNNNNRIKGEPRSAASFHGRVPSPKTQQLDRRRSLLSPSAAEGGNLPSTSRVPTKVLVNVTVQRSLWSVQVVASTDWKVEDLVAASLLQYVKEGRRPLLPSTDSTSFDLHYSQFSLESLDPEEKLIGLGSRNFFLCPKPQPQPQPQPQHIDSAATATATATAVSRSCCSNEAADVGTPPKVLFFSWLKFMVFLQ